MVFTDLETIRDFSTLSKNSVRPLDVLKHELDNHLAWVAEVDNRAVGCLFAGRVLDELEIFDIAVHPDFRRKGMARTLVRGLFEYAQENQAVKIHLEVRASNQAARTLYESMGFSATGSRKGYYPDGEEARLMTKFLS